MNKQFKTKILDENFEKLLVQFDDPVITGRQLIDSAGKRPVNNYIALQQLSNHSLEEIRLDETIDLRKPGIEKFFVIESDRTYRFTVNDHRLQWPQELITGESIKRLMKIPSHFELYLEKRDSKDLVIEDSDAVNLNDGGVEHIYSQKPEKICIFINTEETLVEPSEISFEELVQLAFPDFPVGPNTSFTVSYRKGPEINPEGTLINGESVTITKGMIFNVTATDKS
ncbi:MAG: multiubiquitin domain-containing protein [Candidatus Thiodiazotropha taylori]